MLGRLFRALRGPLSVLALPAVFFTGLWFVSMAPTSTASTTTPITLGSTATAQITADGGSERFGFTANEGQRLFVMPTSQTNGTRLDWYVTDAFGRIVLSDIANFGNLGPLGPAPLMGGTYELVVEAQPGFTGTVDFGLDEPDDSTTSITLGQPVSADIGTPGEIDRFTLELGAPARFLFDLQGASAPNQVGVVITDGLGFEQQALTNRLQDLGPFTLPAGLATIELRSELGAQSTYAFELVERVDTLAPAVAVDTVTTTQVATAETVAVPIVVPAPGSFSLELLTALNGNALNWKLEGPSGFVVFDFTSSLTDRAPVALEAGTHTLTFRAEGGSDGEAMWRLNSVSETTQPINYQTVTNAALTVPGDRHHFTFTAAAGDVISVDVQSGTNTTFLEWSLTDATGRDVLDGSLYDVALLAGDYTLTMAARTGAVGSATFELVPKVESTTAVTIGGPATSGVVDTVGETLRYTFTASQGELVDVAFASVVNASLLNFRVIDASGREVVARTPSLTTFAALPLMGGDYVVEVLPQGSALGSFDLQLVNVGTSSYVPTGAAVTLGQEVVGSVSSLSGPQQHTVALSAVGEVYFELLQGQAQLDWELLDPVGASVFSANATSNGDRGPFALQPGTYTLEFSAPTSASLDYRFAVYEVPTATPVAVAVGDTVSGSLDVPGEVDAFTLSLANDLTLFPEHLAGGLQLAWRMVDATGHEVIPETQGILGGRPYTLGSGTYTLFVRTLDGSRTNYEFVLHASTATEVLASVDQEVFGEILTPGSTVTYRFDLAEDLPYAVFDIIDGDSGLFWELTDDLGRPVFESRQAPFAGSDVGPLSLSAGTYRLRIDPNFANVIDWRFALVNSREVTVTGAVDANLEHRFMVPREARVWTIDLLEPQKLYFDVQTIGSIFHRFDVTVTHQPSGWVVHAEDGINTANQDGGPFVLPPGTIEIRALHMGTESNTFGFVLGSVLDDDRGEISRNWVVEAGVQTPGGSVRYALTSTSASEPVTFDLMRGSNAARWSLFDPVGTPVFGQAIAERATNDDQGPFFLAPGVYDLVLDPEGHDITDVMFRVSTPVPPPAPGDDEGCPNCDELDIVFVFDTSVSMNDEAQQMCDLADDFVASLRQEGIGVTTAYWGITNTNGNPCATSTVVAELGAEVPGGPPPDLSEVGACIAGGEPAEDWALASVVLADRYPWRDGAVRLVVPLTDEGPACGGREFDCGIGGCRISLNQADTDVVDFATQIVSLRNVVVSPILTAADVDEPTIAYAERMAQGAGGVMTAATFEAADLVPTVTAIADAACDTQQTPTDPFVDVLSPPAGARLPAGVPFVMSGHLLPANVLRPLASVRINQSPVDVFDGAGAFFHEVTLVPGPNRFVLALGQSCGGAIVEVVYEGIDPADAIAAAGYSDVTTQIDDTFSATTYARSDERLLGKVEARNVGAGLPGPLFFVVGADLDASVTPLGPTDVSPSGEPLYEVVPKGQTLAHGATSAPYELSFDNPKPTNAHFTRRWLAPANQAPVFTSAPPTQVVPGGTYRYVPTATDPNGDSVRFTIEMAPAGMTLTRGEVSWTPTVQGTFDVLVRARDGAGGFADQRYALTVGPAGPNSPPLFTTAPPTQIDSGADYAYDARATDADNDPIMFSLPTAPAGMTVSAGGQVRWSSPPDGSYLLGLQASDGQGNVASQGFTLTVGPPTADTQAPLFTSLPGLYAVVDTPYAYLATATDGDDDPLTWSLVAAPSGMNVEPTTGAVAFTPTVAQLGPQSVTLAVSDGQGGQAEQSWTLDVRSTPPNGTPYFVTTPVREIEPGVPYRYDAEVVDPELESVAYSLVTAPVGMIVSTDGVLTWTAPPVASQHDVVLRAVDPQGAAAEQSFTITVVGSLPDADGIAVIDITSPADGSRVGAPVDVVATVDISDGATVASWEVPGIASGTGPLPAVLGTFDPTLRDNGLHDIELRIIDSFGRAASGSVGVVVDGEMKLGSYDVTFVDAEWQSSLFGAQMLRAYTTLRRDEVGDFGHGWDLAMGNVEVSTNGPLGDGGWSPVSCGSSGLVFATICAQTQQPHIVIVRWPGGQVDVFDLTPAGGSTFFAPLVPVAYTARPGTDATLAPVSGDESAFFVGDTLRAGFGSSLYDPKQFWLTDNLGNQYLLDVDEGLLQTIDRNGNSVRYGPDGIVPDRGVGVTFQRDGQGRITKMDLPEGSIEYRYDAAGDLVEVQDQVGAVTTYTYDGAHRLVDYGRSGRPPEIEVVYDAEGRVARTIVDGQVREELHDVDGWSSTVVGPDPRLRSTSYFDGDGQAVRIVSDGDGELREVSATYVDGRIASYTEVGGLVTTFAYDDRGRVTDVVDAEGRLHQTRYNAFGGVTERRINGRLVSSANYDARGNLLERRGPHGEVLSTLTYNEWGGPTSVQDADGTRSELYYDARGQVNGVGLDVPPPLPFTGGSGAVAPPSGGMTYSFTLGPAGEVIGVDNGSTTVPLVTLNQRGQMIAYTDENFHTQRWEYLNDEGWLIAIIDKNGNRNEFKYDDFGRMESEVTRFGDRILWFYDNFGRVTEVRGPDAFVSYSYDIWGQLTQIRNESAVVRITWHPRGYPLSVVTKPNGGPSERINYVYSAAGRLLGFNSKHGSQSVTFDSEGRAESLVDSNSGAWNYVWRDDGALDSVTAPNGTTTTYGYSPGVRLQSILATDAGGATLQSLTIERGPYGEVLRRIDHDGAHDYTYTSSVQIASVDHPPGSPLADETYTYDALGNRTSWVGHPAPDVLHDAADRLVSDAIFDYTYDAEGRLIRRTQRSNNAVTRYIWNSFDELVEVRDPDGTSHRYRYDGLGRRIEVDDGGTVRRYLYNGHAPVAELDGNGDLVTWRVVDFWGDLVAEWSPTGERQFFADQMRNRVGWQDATGVTWEERDTFRNAITPASTIQHQVMDWHSQDATGLIYMRARYMDPAVGRFISEDPWAAGDLYSYARNDPMGVWDPFGLTAATEKGLIDGNTSRATKPGATAIGIRVRCILMTTAEGIALGLIGGQIDPASIVIDWAECAVAAGAPTTGCFPGGTPVSTPLGAVDIEAVEAGDLVIAVAGEDGEWVFVRPAGATEGGAK